MKRFLFFLLCANQTLAQTDTALVQQKDTAARQQNMEAVYITATRAGANAPTAYTNLSRDAVQKNNLGPDLPVLLDQTPSVVYTTDAGAGIGYTGLRIRGSDATRINVTLNGIPVNDAESQQMYWVNTPDVVSSVSNIQIQRGIGSSTNGSSAFGGQISLQSTAIADKPYGEAGVALGSFNTFKGNMRGGTGTLKCGFFADASASWIRSDGYIDRASSDLRSWFAQMGWVGRNTILKTLYFGGREKTYQAWYGVPQDSLATNRTFNIAGTDYFSKDPAYPNETDNYGQDYIQLHLAQRLPRNLQLNAALFATLGRGYYEQYKAGADIQDYFADYSSTETDLVRQRWLKNVFYGGTFSLSYSQGKVDVTAGGLVSQYRGQHFGRVVWNEAAISIDKNRNYYLGNSLKTDINVYTKLNYLLIEKLNLYADVQYRFIDYRTKGDDNNDVVYDFAARWHFFNPKAGLLYQIKPVHHLYASYAFGNREPNRDDVLDAPIAPRPEQMHNVEAGYKFLHDKFPISINYYLMHYKDQLVLTGKLNDVGNPIKANVPVSYRTGVELNGSIRILKKAVWGDDCESCAKAKEPYLFSINYSFTYSVNKIKRFDEYIYTYDENYSRIDTLTQIITHRNTDISFSPRFIASVELLATPVTGLELSLTTKIVSRQFMDNTGNPERMLKTFFYPNFRASYKLPLKREDKEIRFTVLLNNILNRSFESNGYTYSERYAYTDENNLLQTTDTNTYNYFYPQAPFNFLAGMQVKF
ncbi:MAG: TonB-dependent receptor [Bacteroidetes bacterium]|nr:TonB-dependent receptor [Bacteroidota bacterium]